MVGAGGDIPYVKRERDQEDVEASVANPPAKRIKDATAIHGAASRYDTPESSNQPSLPKQAVPSHQPQPEVADDMEEVDDEDDDDDDGGEIVEIEDTHSKPDFMVKLGNAISEIGMPGTFAFSAKVDWQKLPPSSLSVNGVGRIGLPVWPQQAEALKAICRTSAAENLMIDAGEITFSAAWDDAVQNLAISASQSLGVVSKTIKAAFSKMVLLQAESRIAAPPQDNIEKGNFGTFLLQLPSGYKGGQSVIQFGESKKTYSLDVESDLHFHYLAYYSNTSVNTLPVTEGWKICLLYNLVHVPERTDESIPCAVDYDGIQKAFSSALATWRLSNHCDKLLIKLENDYADKTIGKDNVFPLSFDGLVGRDRTMLNVLRNIKEPDGSPVQLCLVLVEMKNHGSGEGPKGYNSDEDCSLCNGTRERSCRRCDPWEECYHDGFYDEDADDGCEHSSYPKEVFNFEMEEVNSTEFNFIWKRDKGLPLDTNFKPRLDPMKELVNDTAMNIYDLFEEEAEPQQQFYEGAGSVTFVYRKAFMVIGPQSWQWEGLTLTAIFDQLKSSQPMADSVTGTTGKLIDALLQKLPSQPYTLYTYSSNMAAQEIEALQHCIRLRAIGQLPKAISIFNKKPLSQSEAGIVFRLFCEAASIGKYSENEALRAACLRVMLFSSTSSSGNILFKNFIRHLPTFGPSFAPTALKCIYRKLMQNNADKSGVNWFEKWQSCPVPFFEILCVFPVACRDEITGTLKKSGNLSYSSQMHLLQTCPQEFKETLIEGILNNANVQVFYNANTTNTTNTIVLACVREALKLNSQPLYKCLLNKCPTLTISLHVSVVIELMKASAITLAFLDGLLSRKLDAVEFARISSHLSSIVKFGNSTLDEKLFLIAPRLGLKSMLSVIAAYLKVQRPCTGLINTLLSSTLTGFEEVQLFVTNASPIVQMNNSEINQRLSEFLLRNYQNKDCKSIMRLFLKQPFVLPLLKNPSLPFRGLAEKYVHAVTTSAPPSMNWKLPSVAAQTTDPQMKEFLSSDRKELIVTGFGSIKDARNYAYKFGNLWRYVSLEARGSGKKSQARVLKVATDYQKHKEAHEVRLRDALEIKRHL
ncbi:hypothetical protein HDU97_008312 [Phlyctochytrium planicorne]|nr:hypothetical protein HDU97_008312 [Phlyctochytrium planicorne]